MSKKSFKSRQPAARRERAIVRRYLRAATMYHSPDTPDTTSGGAMVEIAEAIELEMERAHAAINRLRGYEDKGPSKKSVEWFEVTGVTKNGLKLKRESK